MNEQQSRQVELNRVDAVAPAQDTTNPVRSVTEVKKRSSRPVLVGVLALVIAVLGGLATLVVYKYFFEKSATVKTTQQSTSQPSSSTKLTAKQTVALVSPKISGTPATNGMYSVPATRVSGYAYYVQPDVTKDTKAVGVVKLVDASQTPVDIAAVGKILVDKGFAAKKFIVPAEGETYTRYTNADVACAVASAPGSNAAAQQTVSVGCYDMTSYKQLSEASKPLATVYLNDRTTTTTDTLFVGEPTIASSQTTGYKTGELSASGYTEVEAVSGGFVALFYQTPDKIWHFFKGTQSNVPCSDYSTPDLKKAYLGTKCYDQATNSDQATVKL